MSAATSPGTGLAYGLRRGLRRLGHSPHDFRLAPVNLTFTSGDGAGFKQTTDDSAAIAVATRDFPGFDPKPRCPRRVSAARSLAGTARSWSP